MDLLWGIAKRYYEDLPMPSEIWTNVNKIDRRSANQIIDDLIRKYGGEMVDGSDVPSGKADAG